MDKNAHIDQTGKMDKKCGNPRGGTLGVVEPWRTQNTTPLKGPILSTTYLCKFKSVIVQPSKAVKRWRDGWRSDAQTWNGSSGH